MKQKTLKVTMKAATKQLACCALAASMIFGALPVNLYTGAQSVTVQAAQTETGKLTYQEGNATYTYQIENDNAVEIIDYSGTDTEITIPEEIDGKKVTSIGLYAFRDCSSLNNITIPEGVTSIWSFAFYNCSSLSSIMLPAGVTYIGHSTFSGCSRLSSITLPAGVTYIGRYAFQGCSRLSSITIPASVTSISGDAFMGCSSLTGIEVAEDNQNYQSIDGVLFDKAGKRLIRCPGGKKGSYSVSAGVTNIDDFAFSGCSSLTGIEVTEDNQNYQSVDGVLFNKAGTELIACPGGKKGSYSVPEGVTSIVDEAFRDCSSLSSITIPEGVTSIGNFAFSECRSLSSITIPEGVTSIGHWAFSECRSLSSITIPEGVTSIESDAFFYCISLSSIILPRGVTSIEHEAFNGCSSLSSITIPEGVTSIGDYAFQGCSSLNSITLPEGVTSIGAGAFRGCRLLTMIKIPKGVTEIGDYSLGYYDGVSLKNFTILGYDNTAAQAYASQNGFKFIELDEKTSDSGVNVEFPKDSIANADSVSLVSKQLTAADKEYQNIVIADKLIDTNIKPGNVRFTTYDITLKNSAGTAVQPKGKVTVKMPVPAGYDGAKCKVYYVNDKGEFVDMKAVYTGDYMIFETTHFSTYMITDTQMKSVEEQTAIYGDANNDGTVNSKDVVMMKKHLAGYTVDIDLSVCDVNGDGAVNSKDVVLVMKKLAGYDVALGK